MKNFSLQNRVALVFLIGGAFILGIAALFKSCAYSTAQTKAREIERKEEALYLVADEMNGGWRTRDALTEVGGHAEIWEGTLSGDDLDLLKKYGLSEALLRPEEKQYLICVNLRKALALMAENFPDMNITPLEYVTYNGKFYIFKVLVVFPKHKMPR